MHYCMFVLKCLLEKVNSLVTWQATVTEMGFYSSHCGTCRWIHKHCIIFGKDRYEDIHFPFAWFLLSTKGMVLSISPAVCLPATHTTAIDTMKLSHGNTVQNNRVGVNFHCITKHRTNLTISRENRQYISPDAQYDQTFISNDDYLKEGNFHDTPLNFWHALPR